MEKQKEEVPVKLQVIGTIAIIIVTGIVLMIQNKLMTNVEIKNKEEKATFTQVAKVESEDRTNITSRSSSIDRSVTLDSVIEKTLKEEKEREEAKYISIDEVTISKNMDLTVRTGLSKKSFKKLIKNCRYDTSGFFLENADLIYDLCEKYEINEIFFCGLISAESGWNIASNHRAKHNYISLMTSNGMKYFSSVEEGLEGAAKALHNNYLSESGSYYHGKTLYGVRTCFCPSDTWVDLVYGRMQQLV